MGTEIRLILEENGNFELAEMILLCKLLSLWSYEYGLDMRKIQFWGVDGDGQIWM
jgi:hypothetical protein